MRIRNYLVRIGATTLLLYTSLPTPAAPYLIASRVGLLLPTAAAAGFSSQPSPARNINNKNNNENLAAGPLLSARVSDGLEESNPDGSPSEIAAAAVSADVPIPMFRQGKVGNMVAFLREKITVPRDQIKSSPRVQSIIYMAIAMSCHFGGYEFLRNSCLALFTSSKYYGFQSPAAFPLVNGLISPFSLLLLYGYSQQLEANGPRVALRNTNAACTVFIAASSMILYILSHQPAGFFTKSVSQGLVAISFLFQSSYQYLIYTQQWSFVSSVMTPDEGSRWFATLAGLSSLVCTFTGAAVPGLVRTLGLHGLMACTCITLTACMVCCDRAYALAQKHGFDPTTEKTGTSKSKKKDEKSDENKLSKAIALFRREKTLLALFGEVLSFQSLNTILNVAFVRALKLHLPIDVERSAYTGRFYSLINAVSTALQFFILPAFMKYTEPAYIWRIMPIIPMAVCFYQAFVLSGTVSLTLTATAFFLAKLMDYSIRSVVYAMVYQPLDFECRYVGKEIIGVFGSRFGKSGMSVILSALTALGLTGMAQLNFLSFLATALWMSSTTWLSFLIPRKAEAQATVERRQQQQRDDQQQQQQDSAANSHGATTATEHSDGKNLKAE